MKKVEKLRKWMAVNDYDGIILGRRDNYTWISDGAKNHVTSNGKCITRAVRQDMAAENLLLFPGLIKKYIRDRHMHGIQQFREQNVKKQLI